MANKQLYDNLYKVIKANSGAHEANDNVKTEILDLQIPYGYCARIRRVIFRDHALTDQLDITRMKSSGCLVLDPDDEDSYQIPNFTVDHDVLCDFEHEYMRFVEDTTPNGISVAHNQETVHDFDEQMDVVTVRNVRFNTLTTGMDIDPGIFQMHIEVYFTYEKVGIDLYTKLLGIS